VMIFRAVQELLATAHQQSQATQIKVHLDISDTAVKVVVEDNGRGFEPDHLEKEVGVGIKLIRERVEMLGGFFEVDSVIGQGTRVNFQVPAEKLSE